jgi:hypothetical protein
VHVAILRGVAGRGLRAVAATRSITSRSHRHPTQFCGLDEMEVIDACAMDSVAASVFWKPKNPRQAQICCGVQGHAGERRRLALDILDCRERFTTTSSFVRSHQGAFLFLNSLLVTSLNKDF